MVFRGAPGVRLRRAARDGIAPWASLGGLRALSHRESAKNTGVSPTTVPNLEAGKVSEAQRRTTRKLAQALGVDPAELVGDYPLHLVKVSHHAQYLELSRTREKLYDSVFTKSNLFDTIFP